MNQPTTTTAPAQTTATPRNQYIFIDCENVCETDLSRIVGKPVKVIMLLGARHKNLPVSLFLLAQKHPGQLRIIQTQVEGRNALDLVLTLELGRMIDADPMGYFHIVSKDTDFDSAVRHLRSEKKLIARHASLVEIPALRTPEERLAHLQAELEDPAKPRPATRKTLMNKIKSAFQHNTEPELIETAIKSFIQAGLLDFTENDKVLYKVA
jgi:hypothetical protein